MLSFECIKNEKSVYFLLTSAGTDHLAIYGFSIALIPKIEKQVGCNENLNGYLPNSQKKARGNVRKTAKIIIRASS